MTDTTRHERLKADLAAVRKLHEASNLFTFEATGDPPDRFQLTFHGQGLARDTSAHSEVEFVALHRCELRLPYSYPERGPDIRWLTPIFHPNISFSGYLDLKQIGLVWDQHITLDVVVERLWDVARFAYCDLDNAVNHAAKNWLEKSTLRLPLDHRPLRVASAAKPSNVVRYELRPGSKIELPAARQDADTFYIGDDAGGPEPPPGRSPPPGAEHGPPDEDDGILYIR